MKNEWKPYPSSKGKYEYLNNKQDMLVRVEPNLMGTFLYQHDREVGWANTLEEARMFVEEYFELMHFKREVYH